MELKGSVVEWKNQVDEYTSLPNGANIPMVLLSNKYDLIAKFDVGKHKDYMTQEYLEDYAQQNGFSAAFQTSAKTDYNITDSFLYLITQILSIEVPIPQKREKIGSMRLSQHSYKAKRKHCCK